MVSSSRLTCISECSHSGGVVGHELHQLEADVCQVERLAGVREVDSCVHVAGGKLSLVGERIRLVDESGRSKMTCCDTGEGVSWIRGDSSSFVLQPASSSSTASASVPPSSKLLPTRPVRLLYATKTKHPLDDDFVVWTIQHVDAKRPQSSTTVVVAPEETFCQHSAIRRRRGLTRRTSTPAAMLKPVLIKQTVATA